MIIYPWRTECSARFLISRPPRTSSAASSSGSKTAVRVSASRWVRLKSIGSAPGAGGPPVARHALFAPLRNGCGRTVPCNRVPNTIRQADPAQRETERVNIGNIPHLPMEVFRLRELSKDGLLPNATMSNHPFAAFDRLPRVVCCA